MILPWRDTGIVSSDERRTEHAYVFAGCLLLKIWNGERMTHIFFAPDGRRFCNEQELINYMDKTNGAVSTRRRSR